MYLSEYFLYLSPLLLYCAWRIWTLVGIRWLKPVSTLLFALIALAYPMADKITRILGSEDRALLIACYSAMPLLVYLVLSIVAIDLTVALSQLLKIVSRERIRSKGFRRARLAVTLFIPAAVMTWGFYNHNTIRIKEYAIDVPRRSSPLTELTVAFASDFHLGRITSPRFMEKFVAKVNGLKADLVLLGGDIIEGGRGSGATAAFAEGFRRVESKIGVYGVLGNHDRFGGDRGAFFEQAGIRILSEAVEKIGGAFYLAGRADGRTARGRKPIEALLEGVPDDLPLILLDHRPTDIENVSRTRVDIQLSGHTHHGQLWPVNFISRRQYLLSWGHMKKGGTHFFVTSGIQTWGPPARTSGRSEIVLIRITFW